MSLVRSNLAVAAGTALSRLTGIARVVMIGLVLGQSALADAYDGANNSPNQIYELVLGGVLSASLVPVFTRHAEDNDDDATSAVITVVAVILAGLTVVSVLAAPLLMQLMMRNLASGVDATAFRGVATSLARLLLVQIFFYGLMALFSAVLNARRRFFAAAWTPVLANVVTIAALLKVRTLLGESPPTLTAARQTDGVLRWLGLGATAGIAAMALTLIPSVARSGLTLRWRFDTKHPAVRQVLRLSGWSLGFAAANIVASIVVRNLASYGSGGPDAYSKAYTFFTLPHGLLAVSIATTFAPDLARFVKHRDRDGLIERVSLGVRMIGLLTIPASVGLFVLRRPLIGAFFEHLNFDATAAERTADALAGLSVGLAGFSIYLFVLRGFQAHTDTRTPFIINLGENLLNVVLAIVFVRRWGVLGLGLAFGIAYLVSAVWALVVLSYKVRGFTLRPIAASLWRQALAGILMGEVVWLVTDRIGADSGLAALARVLVGTVVGAAVYVGTLHVLGSTEMSQITRKSMRASA